MSKQTSPAGNKPVQSVRHRNIKATIWQNQTDKGVVFYNVTITRSYREADTWHDSHSFGYDDLMHVAKLMYDAHSIISELRAKERSGQGKTRPAAAQAPAAFRH